MAAFEYDERSPCHSELELERYYYMYMGMETEALAERGVSTKTMKGQGLVGMRRRRR